MSDLLTAAIDAELAAFPAGRALRAADLGPFDQLHTRGFASTVELAQKAEVLPGSAVLDLGAGLGGPARYLAETYVARVDAVDASAPFVAAARRFHAAWAGDPALVTYRTGDALAPDLPDASYDLVWMQHVAMNIADRAGLYAQVRRVLRHGGRFATYDIVSATGDVYYPTPWAASSDESTVLDAGATRAALEAAGLRIASWHDDTDAARAWARALVTARENGPPPGGRVLAAVFGPSSRERVTNLGRNLLEGRAAVVAIVATAV